MAAKSNSSHSFQKLKLDTTQNNKPAPSSFASLSSPRKDSTQDGHVHSQLTAGAKPQIVPGSVSARHSQNDAYERMGYGSVASSGSDEDVFAVQSKPRTTSISFANEVRLDSGQRVGLEVPVPKSSRSHSRSPESGSYSDQDYLEMPYNVRRHLHHRVGLSRYPLLRTTVDDLANDPEYNDQVASLTSEATASPPLEEAQTPLEPSADFMLSPMTATSPMEFPLYSPRRNYPIRNKSCRSDAGGEEGSLRRASRRSSNRSGRSLSSMSPAASFLARYKASEAPIKPNEPDDEGQGIGYDSEYIIGKQIGYGGFSIVKEVTSIEDGKPVVNAVKIVRKLQRNKSELENEQIQTQFDQEVEIWRFLRHPYILPLLRVYTTDFATFCITKLNKGGTLFDLVRETRRKKRAGLPKHVVKRYTYQLASAMRYLHNDVQVVHRDIKLENVLIDMTVPNAERDGGDVLLCDFGMADFIVSDQRDGPDPHSIGDNQNIGPADTSTSVAGSLQYAAPELFDAPGTLFSTAADVWSFGVIIFALLTANLPFNEGLDIKTVEKIQKGDYSEDLVRNAEAVQDGDLEDVLALVRGCLELDVEKRWTIHHILQSPWLYECEQQYENVSRAWVVNP